jgi:hypothetical protein
VGLALIVMDTISRFQGLLSQVPDIIAPLIVALA